MEPEFSRKEYREDSALARGLKIGNRHAWGKFYDQYAAALVRFIMMRQQCHKDVAEDVAQDAIVVAMERIATYDPRRGSLWAWLCGIAVNKSRESLRTRNRDSRLHERVKGRLPLQGCRTGSESADALDALILLDPRHQEILGLKYVDGYSVREIAERLGKSEKAVESRLTRARAAFRKAHERREEQTIGREEK